MKTQTKKNTPAAAPEKSSAPATNGQANGQAKEAEATTLKPTPVVLTDAQQAVLSAANARKTLDSKLGKVRELDALSRGFARLEATGELLANLEINDGDELTGEDYSNAVLHIVIRDAQRREFKISNPILISAVRLCLYDRIEKRKGEILEKIKGFTLDSI